MHINPLYTLTTRELKKWYRKKVVIIFTFITPIFWLGLFGKSINFYSIFKIPENLSPQMAQIIREFLDQMILKTFGTYDYFSFLATGMFSVFILFNSIFSGMTFIFDRRLGFLNRLLVSPVRREWIYFSRVIASIIKSISQFTALFLIAIALGLKFSEGFGLKEILGIYLALTILSLIFSNIFIAISMKIEEHETSIAISNLLNLPLMFASNSIFPLEQMPNWLKLIAVVNPITHANKIVRMLAFNPSTTLPVESILYLIILSLITTLLGFLVSRKILKHI